MAKKTRITTRRRTAAPRPRRAAGGVEAQRLLHELQVHAEEITVQNEQLLKAQSEIEEARDRFAALYDFAPIGYVSLDPHGVITEINLTGAAMLGKPRAFLINLPLTAMIVREHRDLLTHFIQRACEHHPGKAASVEVKARTDGEHTLCLIARAGTIDGTRGMLFTAMMDVTEERRLEREQRAHADDLQREFSERVAAEARVKLLLERLVTAQEEERRRIARNLHDHLGQQLTALRLTLDTVLQDRRLSTEARQRLSIADDLVKRLDKEVDLLAWDLRPAVLDLGLGAALADLVRRWSVATDVSAEFHQTAPRGARLQPLAEANINRMVQEALNNVAKHANATQVSVLLEISSEDVAVIIEDNGRGFNPDRASDAPSRHSGMGLLGMRERAAQFEGSVQIESSPGQGTTVFVRVPAMTGGGPST
jgi:PAS domain S-box-containing protein